MQEENCTWPRYHTIEICLSFLFIYLGEILLVRKIQTKNYYLAKPSSQAEIFLTDTIDLWYCIGSIPSYCLRMKKSHYFKLFCYMLKYAEKIDAFPFSDCFLPLKFTKNTPKSIKILTNYNQYQNHICLSPYLFHFGLVLKIKDILPSILVYLIIGQNLWAFTLEWIDPVELCLQRQLD